MPVKINISRNQVRARVEKAWALGVPSLTEEIRDDCNEYCKEESGALIASSYEQSDIDKGIIRWRTPYAKRQYWLMTASTEKNPKATWKWAEVAKKHHFRKWKGRAQRALKENL